MKLGFLSASLWIPFVNKSYDIVSISGAFVSEHKQKKYLGRRIPLFNATFINSWKSSSSLLSWLNLEMETEFLHLHLRDFPSPYFSLTLSLPPLMIH